MYVLLLIENEGLGIAAISKWKMFVGKFWKKGTKNFLLSLSATVACAKDSNYYNLTSASTTNLLEGHQKFSYLLLIALSKKDRNR